MIVGSHEILAVIVIFLCVFSLPRVLGNHGFRNSLRLSHKKNISINRKLRLLIVISMLWPISFAIYSKPWEKEFLHFLVLGVGPIVLLWSAIWIKTGTK